MIIISYFITPKCVVRTDEIDACCYWFLFNHLNAQVFSKCLLTYLSVNERLDSIQFCESAFTIMFLVFDSKDAPLEHIL